jgi:hypothetical protein
MPPPLEVGEGSGDPDVIQELHGSRGTTPTDGPPRAPGVGLARPSVGGRPRTHLPTNLP